MLTPVPDGFRPSFRHPTPRLPAVLRRGQTQLRRQAGHLRALVAAVRVRGREQADRRTHAGLKVAEAGLKRLVGRVEADVLAFRRSAGLDGPLRR